MIGHDAWDDHDNPLRKPTWAYKWDEVSEFTGDPNRMYREYTNEFDTLTSEQVIIVMLILKFPSLSEFF